MSRFPLTTTLALLLAVASCAQQPQTTPHGAAPPGGTYQAFVAGPDSISVVDTASGRVLGSLPLGVPAPDWSVLYSVVSRAAQTTVRAQDPRSGSVLRTQTLPGEFSLPSPDLDRLPGGLSPNGAWLALFSQT